MSQRLCPNCHRALEAERVGRRPTVIVGFCPNCDLVVMPGGELAAVIDFPRSSQDRQDLA